MPAAYVVCRMSTRGMSCLNSLLSAFRSERHFASYILSSFPGNTIFTTPNLHTLDYGNGTYLFKSDLRHYINGTDLEKLFSKSISSKDRPFVAANVPSTILHTTQKSEPRCLSDNMSGTSFQ